MAALNHRAVSREYLGEPATFPGGRGRSRSLPVLPAIFLKSGNILPRYTWDANPDRHPW